MPLSRRKYIINLIASGRNEKDILEFRILAPYLKAGKIVH